MPTAGKISKPEFSSGTDPLTIAVAAILTLAAVAGVIYCLAYAIWWLITFWAPTE